MRKRNHRIVGSKFKSKIYFQLTVNTIKMRFSRYLTIILVTSLSIAFIAVSSSLYNNTDKLNSNLNKNYLETDLISVIHSGDKMGMYPIDGTKPFVEDELIEISDNESVAEVTEMYMNNASFFISNGTKTIDSSIRQIVLTIFLNRELCQMILLVSF